MARRNGVTIRKETEKRKHLPLLLLADEQEDMIDRYLNRGTMFVLEEDGSVRGECVVTDEGDGVLEIKNLAITPEYQRQGYGKTMIEYVVERYKEKYSTLQVGTGNSPLTMPFYESCGFRRHHRIKDFFIDNYNHPIFECGVQKCTCAGASLRGRKSAPLCCINLDTATEIKNYVFKVTSDRMHIVDSGLISGHRTAIYDFHKRKSQNQIMILA